MRDSKRSMLNGHVLTVKGLIEDLLSKAGPFEGKAMLEHKLGTELGRMEREINRSEASEPIDRLERTA